MKNKLFIISFVLLTVASSAFSQNKFSIGLIGSRFENLGDGQKLTEIDAPLGYGMIVGYSINKDLTVALTGEYVKDDMANNLGKETDYRAHLSAYFTPFEADVVRPYFSAGLVYTNRNFTYNSTNVEETKGLFDGRFGVGLDYNLLQNIYLNFDAGLYSNGLNIVGWSSSIGLRVSPKIF